MHFTDTETTNNCLSSMIVSVFAFSWHFVCNLEEKKPVLWSRYHNKTFKDQSLRIQDLSRDQKDAGRKQLLSQNLQLVVQPIESSRINMHLGNRNKDTYLSDIKAAQENE
jgi:hypothetical protein